MRCSPANSFGSPLQTVSFLLRPNACEKIRSDEIQLLAVYIRFRWQDLNAKALEISRS